MPPRESRRYANTPKERERLARKACPACGRERADFTPGRDRLCCSPLCSAEYWREHRPTIAGMRLLVFLEQEGTCACCGKEILKTRPAEGRSGSPSWILDHIRPIAMGGDQWDPVNLQVLCVRCNRIKTAQDLGAISW